MKIAVCVKQVPDMNKARFDMKKGSIIREGNNAVVNPDDLAALELALRLREDRPDAKITVLSMGPSQAELALRECLTLGADEAMLLCDRAFAGADSYATAHVLAAAIRPLEPELVLLGRKSADGCTAQVAAALAEMLGLPVVTGVDRMPQLSEDGVTVSRAVNSCRETLFAALPCVLSVDRSALQPRRMNVRAIMAAADKPLAVLGCETLGLAVGECGAAASPTEVAASFVPEKGKGARFLDGPLQKSAAELAAFVKTGKQIGGNGHE